MMVPKLRFKEFNEKWSTATMAEIYSKIRNGFVGTASPFYVSDGVKYLQGKNIKDGFLNENGLIFINRTFHEKQSKTHLKRNDLVMVQSGHVGECAVIDDNFEGANCHAILVLTPKSKLTPSTFFKYYFYSPYGLKNIYTIKTGNTIEHILSSDLKEISVYIPSIDEQNKIANFLSSVDEKITLLNKQYDLLCQYKKGMMQKIFSQGLRFKDENGEDFPEWNSCQLRDVSTRVTRKNKENNQTILTISGRDGLVDQMTYFNKQIASKNVTGYYLIINGEFAYNKSYSQGYPMGAIKMLTNYDKGVVSTLYICFKLNEDQVSNFYQHYFESGLQNRSIEKVAQEGARNHGLLNIGVNDFFDIELRIPSFQEQIKIADFFSTLDDKITIKKVELDRLKSWKQGLLQQMFV
ncbi:TPA: restriction endonuclease subunit S [Enterobacter cloacae subsp. cloacae]|nr:restriction endonuclease subunit S [Enterobacter cloacae subsp. cloacae]